MTDRSTSGLIARNLFRKRSLRVVLLVAAALGLSACAHDANAPVPVIAPAVDPVLAQLADASSRAAKAQESLSRVEQKRTPATAAAVDPAMVPDELKVPVTLDWTGPAHEAVKQIARTIGYGFNQIGPVPTSPLIVTLNAAGQPAYEVLQDIGLQLRNRAQLAVNPVMKRIELRSDNQATSFGQRR